MILPSHDSAILLDDRGPGEKRQDHGWQNHDDEGLRADGRHGRCLVLDKWFPPRIRRSAVAIAFLIKERFYIHGAPLVPHMPIDVATGIEVFDQEKFHAPELRRQVKVAEDGWLKLDERSGVLKSKTVELLQDWGAFLEVLLYREALVHFLGGANLVSQPVEIYSGSQALGTQDLNLLNEQVALAVTAKHEGVGAMRENLQRLLQHTRRRHIQWINLNHHVAEFTTLSR